MAPSRGLQVLQIASRSTPQSLRKIAQPRRSFASFSDRVKDPANRVQSYISRSSDPYLNLSIEDHLLKTSPPDSTILFLYTNRPCIVIGRNQNPWLEVNLAILKAAASGKAIETEPPAIGNVDLIRRRSGGGTVFHDEGNVNWSVICPPASFTRDKHAEMVVRALRKLGVDRARVNERHDIVLDQGPRNAGADSNDTHRTPYTIEDGAGPRPLKVSGSAYKLTRQRALHHATALLGSPNLNIIPQYLHSPGRSFFTARGVESVSSPVGNIGLSNQDFVERVQAEFAKMYGEADRGISAEIVGDECLEIPQIREGYDVLLSADWMYSQTPQFSVNIETQGSKLNLKVIHGVIAEAQVEGAVSQDFAELISGRKVQDVKNWDNLLLSKGGSTDEEEVLLTKRLAEILPVAVAPEDI